MIYQSEAKAQGWRALAVFENGSECLLYLGRSVPQVRAGYGAAYAEVLTDEERAQVRGISLQCWQGAPDQGRWSFKSALPIPSPQAVAAAIADESAPALLPFRRLDVTRDDGELVVHAEGNRLRVGPLG